MTRGRLPEVATAKLRARRFIWASCMVVLVAIGVAGLLTLRPLASGSGSLAFAQRDALVAQQAEDVRTSLAEFQLLIEPTFVTVQPTSAATAKVAQAAELTQTLSVQTQALVRALPSTGLASVARDLATASAAFTNAYTALSPLLAGSAPANIGALIAAERSTFATMWRVTADAQTQLSQAVAPALTASSARVDDAKTNWLIASAFGALAAVMAAFVLGQRAYRRERTERDRAQRQSFGTALQDALEMSTTESDVYRIVGKALDQSVRRPHLEMLVADSSHAHFQRPVSLGSDADAAHLCAVSSPVDCPAAARGHTLVFPTSNALSACPYLEDRPSGPCSAVCVPISIAGKTVGVTHAVGPDNSPPGASDVLYLEITSRRAAERIAMLRAFAESETQARSDPLTGLSNRRSLENRVRDLQRQGIPYAVAYGDLDHFKLLNDRHGHEAGDQALRLFSRVLRDSIRPDDMASRYGGEEFVLVLPSSDTSTATIVLERVRENLSLALTAGRVTPFTVSFGLASSSDADTFEEVLATADHALLAAKAAGRNRVVTAKADAA